MNRRSISLLGAALLLAGCAASQSLAPTAPMPSDIGWSTPRLEPIPAPMTMPPPQRTPGPAERILACDEGTPITVPVGVTSGLAIQFEPGVYVVEIKWAYEELLPEGETEQPWKAVIGKPGGKSSIVYVTANRPGLKTSFMIPTNRGLCLVDARSVQVSKVRVVRVIDPAPLMAATVVQKTRLLPDPMVPAQYHGGYTIEPAEGGPVWKPVGVVDDGRRTYVILPQQISALASPMVRMLGSTGPELINATLAGHVLVIDHLVPQALELRLGAGEGAEVVRVTRGAPTIMHCPRDQGCPDWSERVVGR